MNPSIQTETTPNPKPETQSLGKKMGILLALLILSSIPRFMTGSLIADRQNYFREAIQSVVTGWAQPQENLGLVEFQVPFQRTYTDSKGKFHNESLEIEKSWPQERQITVTTRSDVRHRGIFDVPVFDAEIQIDAILSLEKILKGRDGYLNSKIPYQERPLLDQSLLGIFFSHPETLKDYEGTINGENVEIVRNDKGLSIDLKSFFKNRNSKELKISFKVRFKGHDSLSFSVPKGKNFIRVKSDWKSPGFEGQLPEKYQLTKSGFDAEWKLFEPLASQVIRVNFFESSDIYKQTEKSLKYGFLITLLCMTVFFMFEILGNLKLHFMHYLLLTLPLTMFFVLLIALSEHIGFSASYAASCLSVIVLMVSYFGGIGASRKYLWSFTGILSTVYAVIFVLLKSSDYALLLGSLCLFVVMGSVMMLTKHVNWSSLKLSKDLGNDENKTSLTFDRR